MCSPLFKPDWLDALVIADGAYIVFLVIEQSNWRWDWLAPVLQLVLAATLIEGGVRLYRLFRRYEFF
jgi:hypothetical protein